MSLLEVIDLSATYNRTQILDGVSIRVEEGEVVCILGPNGAGKSTLLRALTGALPYYGGSLIGGSVRFHQRDVTALQPHVLARAGMSFVPDGGRIFSTMTVRENLNMGGFACQGQTTVASRVNRVLARIPLLSPLLERTASSLSTGERQLVALARALVAEPQLVVLDEPTSGLSPAYAKRLLATIRGTVEQEGRSVLLVEQDVKLAIRYSDRGYFLRQGRVETELSTEDLQQWTAGQTEALPDFSRPRD